MKATSKLSGFQIWTLAARLKTLPAAASSAILGTAFALKDGKFHFWPALSALCISILLQVGANFANDLFDYQRGADTSHRLGPTRVIQAGLLSQREIKLGMLVVFSIAGLLGLYLTLVAGWLVIIIGISAMLAALAYTGGPFPYGYHSLGDLFVFLYFGFVAVCGTYYVQANSVTLPAILAGVSMGCLITNILIVNNLRDIETDRAVNKLTMAVRLGVKGTLREFQILLVVAYVIPIALVILSGAYFGSLLAWLSFPFALKLYSDLRDQTGQPLNKTLTGTARLSLVYAILFSIGIFLFI